MNSGPCKGTEYCDERVCVSVCLSVCLSVAGHIFKTACPNFPNFLRMSLATRSCSCDVAIMLGTSGFVDDVTFDRNQPGKGDACKA